MAGDLTLCAFIFTIQWFSEFSILPIISTYLEINNKNNLGNFSIIIPKTNSCLDTVQVYRYLNENFYVHDLDLVFFPLEKRITKY